MKPYKTPITIASQFSMPLMTTIGGSGASQSDARTPQRSIYI